MGTTKKKSSADLAKTTNVGSIKNLTWHHVSPPGMMRPGPSYATSGVFCYEQSTDNDGKTHYRRALWSKILEHADDPKAWLNQPQGIWSPVNP